MYKLQNPVYNFYIPRSEDSFVKVFVIEVKGSVSVDHALVLKFGEFF